MICTVRRISHEPSTEKKVVLKVGSLYEEIGRTDKPYGLIKLTKKNGTYHVEYDDGYTNVISWDGSEFKEYELVGLVFEKG